MQRTGNGPWTKKTYKKKPSPKKTYPKKTYTKKSPAITVNKVKSTNDVHFDEKIAKSEAILGQISKGFDVAAKPIKGVISLAEKYATRAGSFISSLFTKKK